LGDTYRNGSSLAYHQFVDLLMSLRPCAVALVLTLSVLVATSCSGSSSDQPVLSSSQVVGTWIGQAGSMTFHSDQTFSGHLSRPNADICPKVPPQATWAFLSPAGSSGLSLTSYKKGNVIEVTYAGAASDCNFELTSWKIDPPVGICFYADPDSPCTSAPFRKVG